MESAESWEPQLSEIIEGLTAETEHLIEEGRLLASELEITRQELRRLARSGLRKKPAQRCALETDREEMKRAK